MKLFYYEILYSFIYNRINLLIKILRNPTLNRQKLQKFLIIIYKIYVNSILDVICKKKEKKGIKQFATKEMKK